MYTKITFTVDTIPFWHYVKLLVMCNTMSKHVSTCYHN